MRTFQRISRLIRPAIGLPMLMSVPAPSLWSSTARADWVSIDMVIPRVWARVCSRWCSAAGMVKSAVSPR